MFEQSTKIDSLDGLLHLTAAMFTAAVMCICASLLLTSTADHTCDPAAYADPASDVGGFTHAALLTPDVPADSQRASGALSATLTQTQRQRDGIDRGRAVDG